LKTFYIDNIEDWESFSQEHDLEISQCIIDVALKNLDSKKRFYHVMDVECEEEDTILEITLDKKEMINTLETNLLIQERYEQYETCAQVIKAIKYLKNKI
jgi:hypothetical protein